ncbi:MAG: preprotein translocase subunit SecE [Anaerolineales bacterium]|nr:preprotein translocase subunit SecE [Anaerolineales bacterium]
MAKKNVKAKKKKGGVFNYFHLAFTELKRVNWPTRKEAIHLTWIVVAVLVVMSAYLGFADFAFGKLIAFVITLV